MDEVYLNDILARLARAEAKIARLESQRIRARSAAEYESLPDTATVDKSYVAYRFGCSLAAVTRGRAGTHRIPRKSSKPLKFTKRDVDAAWREQTKPVSEKAAEARAAAPTRSRKSILTK